MYDKKEPIRATHRYIYPCDAPKEVNVMFEKSGKLKAGARQDSKSRNEQDSKSRMPLPERRKTVKGKAGMRSIFGKCDIWKQKRITYPASRMRIYL